VTGIRCSSKNPMRTLSRQELDRFHSEGYLIIHDLFQEEDLDPLCDEMHEYINAQVEHLITEGELPAGVRHCLFEQQLARAFEHSAEVGNEIIAGLEGRAGGGYKGKAFYSLLTNTRLLHLIRGLIGDEIVASSAYRIRPKLPGQPKGVVPWHQDSGYFDPICDDHLILTCWIPLVDATAKNGCMQILPRAHREGLLPHVSGGNANFLVIQDDSLPKREPITAECPRGGVVLMSNFTPHCSTWNHSDHIRWSVDLRFQNASEPNNLSLFPDSGADVSAVESYHLACYPPEADLLVASASRPEEVIDFTGFCARRAAFERAHGLPRPRRNWPHIGQGKAHTNSA
jgi:phytanoyl-CoA hydroxylase